MLSQKQDDDTAYILYSRLPAKREFEREEKSEREIATRRNIRKKSTTAKRYDKTAVCKVR